MIKHETCLEYFQRRLSEGWKVVEKDHPFYVLQAPNGGTKKRLDIRHDILTIRPTGDSAVTHARNSGSTNASCVDEATSDGDTTYVYNSSAYPYEPTRIDRYTFGDHSTEEGVIDQIDVHFVARYGEEYGATAKAHVYIASTYYYGSAETLGYGYATFSKAWTTNPNTSAAWTWANIDDLIAGISSTNVNTYHANKVPYYSTSYAYITQVYVEVTYTSGWANIGQVIGASAADIDSIIGAAVADIAEVAGKAV